MNGFDFLVQNRIQAQMFNQHLTHEERSTIASLKRNNCSNAEIAAMTDRHRRKQSRRRACRASLLPCLTCCPGALGIR